MRIAVTGAGGFIGANLVRGLLREGHEVCAILRPGGSEDRLSGLKAALAAADVRDSAALGAILARFQPETIYHLASTTWSREASQEDHEQAITQGMSGVLDACDQWRPRRLITTGSAAEYGSGAGFEEDSPCRPETALGRAKAEACHLAVQRAEQLGIECVWLRLFTPYGPFEAPTRLVPSAIRAALRRVSLTLQSPNEERDFLAVADVVDAMARAAWAPLPNPAIINLSSGRTTNVASLAALIFDCAGVEPRWEESGPEPPGGETLARSSGMNRRAREWLGWIPRLDLNTGIKQAIAWWKEQSS